MDIVCSLQIHVCPDLFRIISDQRAVEMIIADLLIHIVGHARIEDPLHMLIQQPLDVAMHDLGRQPRRITGDAVLRAVIHRLVRLRRDERLIAKLMEEFHPERQEIIHVEHERDARPSSHDDNGPDSCAAARS